MPDETVKLIKTIAAGFGVIVTVGGFVWFAATLSAQVNANSAWILANSDITNRLTRIETLLEQLTDAPR